MSVMVPLDDLREQLDRRANRAYLLTVSDDGRPHCVAVHVGWQEDDLRVGTGRTSARNAAARRQVTLLAPPLSSSAASAAGAGGPAGRPAEHGDYSLIVDGEVTVTHSPDDGAGGDEVTVRPTHAVLHRPAVAPDGGPAHDCVPVYEETGRGPE